MPQSVNRLPRVAVVGCGYWGRNLVRNFASLNALTAICDTDAAAVERMLGEYPHIAAIDFASLLRREDVDAIAIAAPAADHFVLGREALQAGKDVLIEKPLALRVADAQELCAVADHLGAVLMVGHLVQYHPVFVRLKMIVDEGRLGRIQYVYSNRLNLGRFRREEDILWSFAPHDISMILALTGSEPDSVHATGAAYLHKNIADVTTTHLSFPGGERAHVFVSWLHPVKEQKLVVIGDRGMAVFDDGRDWGSKLALYPHRVDWIGRKPAPVLAEPEFIPVPAEEPLKLECEHFLECILLRQTSVTNGYEGVRVLKVLEEATRSMVDNQNSNRESMHQRLASVLIHESSYVDQPVHIGRGSRIWHFSHILAGTWIGKNCTIGQNVMIGPDVRIGNNCKIQNNVSIYKGVVLEDNVFCGPSCVFTNVANPRAEIDRHAQFRPTLVGTGVTIGANATIICGNTLGPYSFVAAGAVVTADVPAHALVAGVPARRLGWVSHAGERLTEDLKCPRTGQTYELVGDDTLRLRA